MSDVADAAHKVFVLWFFRKLADIFEHSVIGLASECLEAFR